ncbi:hypothetical protein NKW44_13085 [Acetobacter lovaniensis]|jgi:hypothetical protein|uniref:hypothetical protein n=1 Tax=Acetobacter lovaniensis TaxID=104100 RepID=UPI00209E5C33|nr:hypothetical protein [Acetobacter lovaniensis]MCI1698865.1 hypothetical protein [Acetobacter lovaniensis]MCP1240602.1 hypothetical protein [Acetobacter lovaniensis]
MSFSFLSSVEFVDEKEKPKGASPRDKFIANIDQQIKSYESSAEGKKHSVTTGKKTREVRLWFSSTDNENFIGDLRFAGMKIEIPGKKGKSIKVTGGIPGLIAFLEQVKEAALKGELDKEINRLHAAVKARRAGKTKAQ